MRLCARPGARQYRHVKIQRRSRAARLQRLAGSAGEWVVVVGLNEDSNVARRSCGHFAGHGQSAEAISEDGQRLEGGAAGAGKLGQRAVVDSRLVGVGQPNGEELRGGDCVRHSGPVAATSSSV